MVAGAEGSCGGWRTVWRGSGHGRPHGEGRDGARKHAGRQGREGGKSRSSTPLFARELVHPRAAAAPLDTCFAIDEQKGIAHNEDQVMVLAALAAKKKFTAWRKLI